ncbi:putative diphthamide synthesis protein-domain-containing protein [Corynascus novoguineensis]|uniref:2-(3-amino-3-carboxypropyl)histidine synthase subunit 2 n=1 Tax=Corynascus novoguineensis TaxID=1126955 RepID=A0AAN7HIK3_9PEZI|nr:putative diphthamide synthesis protein-domain-containing protein [Corynascus novoguineensis]
MAAELSAAPILSTPAEHVFEYAVASPEPEAQSAPKSDDELRELYEIVRTAKEVRQGGWKRIALQFPDHMLRDGPRVVQLLNTELESLQQAANPSSVNERIYILADTSYSACCVDEIAAEHVDADVVVHYGRSCLSPTSRLPVIYVFTHHTLDHDETVTAFEKQYPDKDTKAMLMADVTYHDHIPTLASELHARGYTNLLSTAIVHNPTGAIPNRKLVHPSEATDITIAASDLKSYSIFHISTPPTALLLALSSRVQDLHIHPTSGTISSFSAPTFSTSRLLGRRYARLLTLASAGIIGILVNTLSVANYLSSVDSLRARIAAAGKKSYTVVVGKLNPAKLANFAEVDGWVVVGCWESGLVEDDAGFYRPVVTPFELEVALVGDDKRVWGGEWWGGIEALTGAGDGDGKEERNGEMENGEGDDRVEEEEYDEEEESAPPEFDLRTGKLVSHSRPMRSNGAARAKGKVKVNREGQKESSEGHEKSSSALALRPKAELATVNGVVSPGAEYLRSRRTWQGLGSDYVMEESTTIEEGRSGVARGYTVGEAAERR